MLSLSVAEIYSRADCIDKDVEVNALIASITYSEVWLIDKLTDIEDKKGIRLEHPHLMEALTEDAPSLAGPYRFLFRCQAYGRLKKCDNDSPHYCLLLTRLAIYSAGDAYNVRLLD